MIDNLIKRLREPSTGVVNLVTVTRKSTGEVIEKYDPVYREAADALEALQSQLEEAERDARRYRKVRAIHLQTAPDAWIRTGDDLDDAADAISDAVLAQEQKHD